MQMDEMFMQRALALAREGLAGGAMPIGAVLVRGGEILAESFWRGSGQGLLDHPETAVLRAVDRSIEFKARRQTTLYTTLEPCLMCMGTAASFFLGRIVYAMPARSDGASNVGERWAPAAGHPTQGGAYALPVVEGGVCRDEARSLIESWVAAGARGPEAEFARQLLVDG